MTSSPNAAPWAWMTMLALEYTAACRARGIPSSTWTEMGRFGKLSCSTRRSRSAATPAAHLWGPCHCIQVWYWTTRLDGEGL